MSKTMATLKGWNLASHRWQWMIRGTRVSVTCEELGLRPDDWTQERSRKAAWDRYCQLIGEQKKQSEAAHPHAEKIAELQDQMQVAQSLGIDASEIQSRIETVRTQDPTDTSYVDSDRILSNKMRLAVQLGLDLTGIDPIALEALFGSSDVHQDRKRRSKAVDPDRTLSAAYTLYMSGKQYESRNGIRSADGADNIRRWLAKFIDFAGGQRDTEQIDFDLWERWRVQCLARSKKMQTEEAQKEFSNAKTFVKWLWKSGRLSSLPKNLDDQVKFIRWEKTIVTYDSATVKKVVDLATGQLKLHLLMMLNCGMTQKDISDLKKSQVDLKAGTITRKRSKTELKINTPTVTYHLWQSTLSLLRQHWSSDPVLALTTKSGKPWVWKQTTESGSIKKSDNVRTLLQNFKKKNPTVDLKTLKSMKKSSATLLRNKPEYREFFTLFLGHSEKTIAGKHYADLDQSIFAEAVQWLGKQYCLDKLDQ